VDEEHQTEDHPQKEARGLSPARRIRESDQDDDGPDQEPPWCSPSASVSFLARTRLGGLFSLVLLPCATLRVCWDVRRHRLERGMPDTLPCGSRRSRGTVRDCREGLGRARHRGLGTRRAVGLHTLGRLSTLGAAVLDTLIRRTRTRCRPIRRRRRRWCAHFRRRSLHGDAGGSPLTLLHGRGHECAHPLQPLASAELASQLGVNRVELEHGLKLNVPNGHHENGEVHRPSRTTGDHGVRSHAMSHACRKIRPRRPGDADSCVPTRPDPYRLRRQDDLRCSSTTDGNSRASHKPTEQHDDGQGNRPDAVGGGRGGEELHADGAQRTCPRHRSRQIVLQAVAA